MKPPTGKEQRLRELAKNWRKCAQHLRQKAVDEDSFNARARLFLEVSVLTECADRLEAELDRKEPKAKRK